MRRWRIIAVALLVAVAGCSALRFAYTQAGELVFWWLDGYVDFDTEQTPRVRAAIARWFAWHRASELSDYAALLDRAADEAARDVTPEQVCRWFDVVRERVDRAVTHALPEAAAIAVTLSPEQLRHLERRQRKNNAEFRDDFLQPDPARRHAAAVDRVVERAEQLYGRLDDAQRERISQALVGSPFDPERWLAERQRRQRQLVQTLQRLQGLPPRSGAALDGLQAHWQAVRDAPDADYAAYQDRLDGANCELLAQVHNRTTVEQRREAQRRLRGWEADLRRLAAAAP